MMERIRDGEWGNALLPEHVLLGTTTVRAVRRDVSTGASSASRASVPSLASRPLLEEEASWLRFPA
ncbi:MAG: hypothetical protein P8170_15110, partial [Gemmatimonadota bacterium]